MILQRKKKVFHIIYKLVTGGAETVVMNLLRGFCNDDEFDIRLATTVPFTGLPYEREVLERKYSVVHPFCYYDYLPKHLAQLCSFTTRKLYFDRWLYLQIKKFNPDIIHIHLSKTAIITYNVMKKFSNVPIIYHMHSMPENVRSDFRSQIREALTQRMFIPLCVTEIQRKSAYRFYGIDSNTFVIYNGIDVDKYLNYHQSETERKELRTQWGIAPSDFLIGCVSRGVSVKNNERLVTALKQIVHLQPTAKLLFVGSFSEEYKRSLLELESHNGYGKSRIVWTGVCNDLFKVYQTLDVFALASYYESSSIVSVEAQLSRVPCVLSSMIPNEIVISDGVSVVNPNASSEIWAENIVKQRFQKVNLISDYRKFDLKESFQHLRLFYRSLLH